MRRSTQGMQFELGKIPYSEAKGSRVNRWTSPAAREMLENRRSMDTLESSTISDADSGVLLPLGGGEYVYGFYSARVYLGTPQQPVSLLMDSGSSDLAVNLASCAYAVKPGGGQEGCPGIANFSLNVETSGQCTSTQTFNPDASSTLQDVLCETPGLACVNFNRSTGTCPSSTAPCYDRDCYGDDSGFDAVVYNDTLHVKFGGVFVQYLNFTSDTSSGIFGLAFQNLSAYGEVPAMTRVLQTNNLPNTFSMCLGDGSMTASPDLASGSGFMLLGQPSETSSSSFKGYTAIIDPSYYNVNLQTINVALSGGNTLGAIPVDSRIIPGVQDGTIVDSGTTELLLKEETYVALWNSLIEANIVTDDTCVTQPSSGYCCELDRPISDVFLDFTFESTADAPGTSFTVSRPFSQMVQSCGIGNYFYPTIGTGLGINILGDAFMKNMLVEFDRENGRIGFTVDMDCALHNALWSWLTWVLVAVGILVVLGAILAWRMVVRARTRTASVPGQAPLVRGSTYGTAEAQN